MNIDTFFKTLSQTRGWKLYGPTIRKTTYSRTRGTISYCPITGVCRALTGRYFPEFEYRDAARAIGLKPNTALGIIMAADRSDNRLFPRDARYRRRMLRILGLPIKRG